MYLVVIETDMADMRGYSVPLLWFGRQHRRVCASRPGVAVAPAPKDSQLRCPPRRCPSQFSQHDGRPRSALRGRRSETERNALDRMGSHLGGLHSSRCCLRTAPSRTIQGGHLGHALLRNGMTGGPKQKTDSVSPGVKRRTFFFFQNPVPSHPIATTRYYYVCGNDHAQEWGRGRCLPIKVAPVARLRLRLRLRIDRARPFPRVRLLGTGSAPRPARRVAVVSTKQAIHTHGKERISPYMCVCKHMHR
ncbi:hypothetical protein LZ30DRAFT_268239 [Colletotrichum cereale]|nr:hypothetical protein LZ30DRAFT_268239 [Colletotrichum cereale]